MKRYLILEDGSVFTGNGFGADSEAYGEVVFTTSMTGYQESITDPSYRRQILVFAEPAISNYPLSKDFMEAPRVMVAGVITRNSHMEQRRSDEAESFSRLLARNNIPGMDNVDTRSLILKLRKHGVMRGFISDRKERPSSWPDPFQGDVVAESLFDLPEAEEHDKKVLYINVGSKLSLYSEIAKIFQPIVVTHRSDLFAIGGYDGIFISNGPGDPSSDALRPVVNFLREMIGKKPIIGVCLGHQLVGIAAGMQTFKMKFGHRGSNHAVTDGKNVWITTHNHGYAVKPMAESVLSATMWDVNDGTIERIESREKSVLTVQFHPEACPGPTDGKIVFSHFKRVVDGSWYS